MSSVTYTARLPIITTARLEIRHLSLVEPHAVLDFYVRNQEHLAPTSPRTPPDFHTPPFWETMVASAVEEFFGDRAIRLVGMLHGRSEVVVTVNFTQILRGPLQACYLGYNTDRAHQGVGLMTEALRAAIDYVFAHHNLHRVMANHLPENAASAAVLAKLGFSMEGRAQDYLHIGGRWRDHILNALTNPSWTEG